MFIGVVFIFSILIGLSNTRLVRAQSYDLIMTFPESGVDSEENFGETFAPCRSSGNCSFSCNAVNVGRTCSNLVCAGGSGDSAYFYTHDYACVYTPPICIPDSSCAANTCTTDTCYDLCSNAYAGTKSCSVACTVSNVCGDTATGVLIGAVCSATPPPAVDQCPFDPGIQCSVSECSCIADSSCAASTCTGSTCYDACGNSYGGSKFCGGCVADPSCAASTCSGSTCSDSCGNTYGGTLFCGGGETSGACGDTVTVGVDCIGGQPVSQTCASTERAYEQIASTTRSCLPMNSYSLTYNRGRCQADATCSGSPVPAPNLFINGSNGPLAVTVGTNLNITWGIVANATTCSGTGTSWVGAKVTTGGSDNISASVTSTYTITCTGPGGIGSDSVVITVAGGPVNSLKICENSCSSGLQRSGSSFAMATGSTRNLVACWNTASDCSDGSGNVSPSTAWGEGGGSAISLSGSNPKVVTAGSSGSESVSATYSGNSASTTISVTCVPSVTCGTAPEGLNHCPADTYTVGDGCGATLTCNGRRACDFNWKEVAP